jgi:hypothetical protein
MGASLSALGLQLEHDDYILETPLLDWESMLVLGTNAIQHRNRVFYDRIIVDLRAANAIWITPAPGFPDPELRDFLPEDDQVLYTGMRDLHDWYHQLDFPRNADRESDARVGYDFDTGDDRSVTTASTPSHSDLPELI